MKKNYSISILCVIAILIANCKKNDISTKKLLYDVQINYTSTPILNSEELRSDTLSILFDGNYYNDTVSIMINNRHFKDLILTTDQVTGYAGDIKTKDFNKIDNIGLRINNGKLIFIEPEQRLYNIRLTYQDSIALIRFYRLLPAFR